MYFNVFYFLKGGRLFLHIAVSVPQEVIHATSAAVAVMMALDWLSFTPDICAGQATLKAHKKDELNIHILLQPLITVKHFHHAHRETDRQSGQVR